MSFSIYDLTQRWTMQVKTYQVDYFCENCGQCGKATFEFGKPVPTLFECPNCGCNAARKNSVTYHKWDRKIGDKLDWIYPGNIEEYNPSISISKED